MKHSENVELVKQAGIIMIKEALMGTFIKWLPFLVSGPFNFVAVKLATKLAEELAERGELMLFFKHIDYRVNEQGKDFVSAMIKNHNAQLKGTNDEKSIAEKELIIATNTFVHLMR
jgi:hypothetical protein